MRGDKRERILRVILNSDGVLSKNELSKQAECSRPWVIEFLQKLEEEKISYGRYPKNREKLLDYWLSVADKKKKFREYMVKEPYVILKKTKLEYAVTTYLAENLVQQYLFPSRIDIYIKKEDMEQWHSTFTKQGLYGKGNVRIIMTDNHVMYNKKKIKDIYVVSMPQLIVDLTLEGGPCKEAADMLRNVRTI